MPFNPYPRPAAGYPSHLRSTTGSKTSINLIDTMKLQQGQLWKKDGEYIRIVNWERLAIEYKSMPDLESGEGTLHQLSKKEFCRLIKGAELIDPAN